MDQWLEYILDLLAFGFGTQHTTAGRCPTSTFLNVLAREGTMWLISLILRENTWSVAILEIVIVRQLFARHDTSFSGEQCHPWFTLDSPLDHLAIWLTRMIDEPGYGASRGIADHVLIKHHKVKALSAVRGRIKMLGTDKPRCLCTYSSFGNHTHLE